MSHRFPTLVFPSLLVVDEIGYLRSRTGAMLFFHLVSRRYEHAATVLTSNTLRGARRARMARARLPLDEALRILREVADALEYAHARLTSRSESR